MIKVNSQEDDYWGVTYDTFKIDNYNHMKFLFLAFILFISNALSATDKPNIVFFIADDISIDDLGCYGHPTIKTPNIDKLWETGMGFTNAYLTISSCSPSRCSIITGRYPHNTGAPELHSKLPQNQVKFPQLSKDAGYYTVLSGKNHMGNVSDAFSKISKGKGFGKEKDWVPILQKRPKDKPFFMWFASTDAHKAFLKNGDAPKYDPVDVVIPPYMFDAPKIRKKMTGYYHEVSRFDHYVGEVVQELKTQGVYDNTLIIVMADNGRPFTRAKTRMYDSGIKTPFIVHFPKLIEQHAVSESLISSIDVSATILEIAGIKKDEGIQGQSFTSILENPKATVRELVFAEHNWHVYQAHERMVRKGNYLYIKNNFPEQPLWGPEAGYKELNAAYKAGKLNEAQLNVFRKTCPEEELYSVGNDMHQLINLANNPKHEAVLQTMRKLLVQWTKETGDNVPGNSTQDRTSVMGKGRNSHREFPGKATGAETINHPGPILLNQD